MLASEIRVPQGQHGHTRPARGAARSLGTNDGICFTPPEPPLERDPVDVAKALDWETGELKYSDEQRRLGRWEMQAAARKLLDSPRLRACYRQPLEEHVRVYRRRESASTYYRGLRVCGKVWECPVCSAKVSERKRLELLRAIDLHTATGGAVMLLTLTVPHAREDSPFWLLGRLLEAYRKFGQGKRAWTAQVPGYVGSVRALEVTHGDMNGWHPHLHVLVFLAETPGNVKDLEAKLLDHWRTVTLRNGLGEVNGNGLRLEDGLKAGKYATKWGPADEMTRAHMKMGRKKGRTPWAMLADYVQGDKRAGALFVEFTQAFRKRSQLQWSRGLRDRLGLVVEKTDEELAEEIALQEDELRAKFTVPDWKLICRHELRGLVLELLRDSTREAVDLLLSQYRNQAAQPEPTSCTGATPHTLEPFDTAQKRKGAEETNPKGVRGAEDRTGARALLAHGRAGAQRAGQSPGLFGALECQAAETDSTDVGRRTTRARRESA